MIDIKTDTNDAELGEIQEKVLRLLNFHKHWYPGCGWLWGTYSKTKRILDSLVKKGLAKTGTYFFEDEFAILLYGKKRDRAYFPDKKDEDCNYNSFIDLQHSSVMLPDRWIMKKLSKYTEVKMKIAIHQPHYFPNLAYFYKIAKCDIFVFLDTAQYSKNNWINRNKIKTPTGWQWLTVPVAYNFGDRIMDIETASSEWQPRHLKSLEMNYKKAPFFDEVFSAIKYHIAATGWSCCLAGLNERLIHELSIRLKLNTIFLHASNYNLEGKSTELLVNIVERLRGTQYLSGTGAKKYMDESLFEVAGIELIYTDFKHPEYNQLWGDFIPNLSILDLLFNHGFKESRKILLGE